MPEEMKELFNESEASETTGTRSLPGTAQLTSIATALTTSTMQTIETDFDKYKDKVAASKVDHHAMDELIKPFIDLNVTDVSFLQECSDDEIAGMLKSQQSKRSRSKGKVMTMANYRNMMTAAFAEDLIRIATNQPKSITGPRRSAGQVLFSAEELEELSRDQDRIRRELRNVQSKKSIAKAKDDFDESSQKWQDLLKAEEQLRGIRIDYARATRVDSTQRKLTDLMKDAEDIEHMKPADARKLLDQIKQLTAEPDENPHNVQDTMIHVPDAHEQ